MIVKKLFENVKKEKIDNLFYDLGRIKSTAELLETQLEFYANDRKGFEKRTVKTIFTLMELLLKMLVKFPISIIKSEYKNIINKDDE